MKVILFLDDYRDPFADGRVHLPVKEEGDESVAWVKTFQQFKSWIEQNGLPDHICFDHDLHKEHYHKDMYKGMVAYNKHYQNFKHKTGRDAAMWLIQYCQANKKPIPKWTVHSSNPVGKENIKMLLKAFTK